MAHRNHVNVDLLYSRLPRRIQASLDILGSALFFAFMSALLYFASFQAWESLADLETSYSAWNPPIYPFKAAVPLAAALLFLQGLAKLAEDVFIAFGYPDYRLSIAESHFEH